MVFFNQRLVYDRLCFWWKRRKPTVAPSWEQNRPKWTQWAAHSPWHRLVPSTFAAASWIFLIFKVLPLLSLFPLTPHSLPIISTFTEPASQPPPFLPSGAPSWGSLPLIGGPMIAGLGARSGTHQINPTDFTICLPLGLMTVLAFHTQPHRLDQICGIDLRGVWGGQGSRRSGQIWATVLFALHKDTKNATHMNTTSTWRLLPKQWWSSERRVLEGKGGGGGGGSSFFTVITAGGADSCCAVFSMLTQFHCEILPFKRDFGWILFGIRQKQYLASFAKRSGDSALRCDVLE